MYLTAQHVAPLVVARSFTATAATPTGNHGDADDMSAARPRRDRSDPRQPVPREGDRHGPTTDEQGCDSASRWDDRGTYPRKGTDGGAEAL